jgi:hypothetical protein
LQNKIQITSYGVATIYHKDALQCVFRWLRAHKTENLCVHVGFIHAVEQVAACCPLWPRHMVLQNFATAYFQHPNLTAALLHDLRQKWGRLERSKAGKLKKYFSQNPVVKWDDSFNSRAAIKEAEAIRKFLKEKEPQIPMTGGAREVTQADLDHLALSDNIWAKRKHAGPVPEPLGNVPLRDLPDKHIQTALEKLPWGKGITIDDIVKARQWVAVEQRAGKKLAEKVLDKDGFLQVKAMSRRRETGRARARKQWKL